MIQSILLNYTLLSILVAKKAPGQEARGFGSRYLALACQQVTLEPSPSLDHMKDAHV